MVIKLLKVESQGSKHVLFSRLLLLCRGEKSLLMGEQNLSLLCIFHITWILYITYIHLNLWINHYYLFWRIALKVLFCELCFCIKLYIYKTFAFETFTGEYVVNNVRFLFVTSQNRTEKIFEGMYTVFNSNCIYSFINQTIKKYQSTLLQVQWHLGTRQEIVGMKCSEVSDQRKVKLFQEFLGL